MRLPRCVYASAVTTPAGGAASRACQTLVSSHARHFAQMPCQGYHGKGMLDGWPVCLSIANAPFGHGGRSKLETSNSVSFWRPGMRSSRCRCACGSVSHPTIETRRPLRNSEECEATVERMARAAVGSAVVGRMPLWTPDPSPFDASSLTLRRTKTTRQGKFQPIWLDGDSVFA